METKSEAPKVHALPVEILQLIFQEFSSLKDIQVCYQTCERWKKIIAKMFEDKGNYQILCRTV